MARRVRSNTSSYRAGSPARRSDRPAPTGQRPPAKPDGTTIARLFANGRSQAVRLPKEFRFSGDAVRISRDGRRVILEPLDDGPCDARGWPVGLWGTLDGMGGDFPDIPPLPARLLSPDDIGPLAPPDDKR